MRSKRVGKEIPEIGPEIPSHISCPRKLKKVRNGAILCAWLNPKGSQCWKCLRLVSKSFWMSA